MHQLTNIMSKLVRQKDSTKIHVTVCKKVVYTIRHSFVTQIINLCTTDCVFVKVLGEHEVSNFPVHTTLIFEPIFFYFVENPNTSTTANIASGVNECFVWIIFRFTKSLEVAYYNFSTNTLKGNNKMVRRLGELVIFAIRNRQ